MYYRPDFLRAKWAEYLDREGIPETAVDPDAFVRWTYARALALRQPRYANLADWGVKITADEAAAVRTPADFDDLIATALARRAARA